MTDKQTKTEEMREAEMALEKAAPAEWKAYQETVAREIATLDKIDAENDGKINFRASFWPSLKAMWKGITAGRGVKKAAPDKWKAYKDAEMREVNERWRKMRNRMRIGRGKR